MKKHLYDLLIGTLVVAIAMTLAGVAIFLMVTIPMIVTGVCLLTASYAIGKIIREVNEKKK